MSIISKIGSILTKKDKWHLFGLLLLSLLSVFFDLFSISLINSVVSILSYGENAASGSIFVKIVSKVFKTTDVNTLFVASLSSLMFFIIVKAVYQIFFSYLMNNFSLNYSRKLSKKLLETYLSMPYEYHLDNNSATLVRKSIYDVDCFTSAIQGFLNLLVTSLSVILITIYLAFTSYIVTLIIVGLLAIVCVLILLIIKPRTRNYGKKLQSLNSNNYKFLNQAFHGIKESKMLNAETYFSTNYDNNKKEINSTYIKASILSSIPRQLIEVIGMLALSISLCIIKIAQGAPENDVIAIFTIFVYATIKLLPSVINVTSIVNMFSFYKSSVDTIYDDLTFVKENEAIRTNEDVKDFSFNNDIKVNHINFAYKNSLDKVVLNDISLEVKKNTSVAISGASGCGKTTLIDILLGLLSPTSGEILIDGVNFNENLRGWRKNCSYVPQEIYLMDDTVKNNIAFGLRDEEIDEDRVWYALKMAELDEFVGGLKDKLETVVGERGVRLSGGQRQRIGIARAFYRNTNVIIFDEATSSLDYETERQILEHLSKNAKDHTLIIVTHRLNTIESCDSIYRIFENKISKVK